MYKWLYVCIYRTERKVGDVAAPVCTRCQTLWRLGVPQAAPILFSTLATPDPSSDSFSRCILSLSNLPPSYFYRVRTAKLRFDTLFILPPTRHRLGSPLQKLRLLLRLSFRTRYHLSRRYESEIGSSLGGFLAKVMIIVAWLSTASSIGFP